MRYLLYQVRTLKYVACAGRSPLTSSIPSGTRCETCTGLISGSPMHPQSAKIRALIKVLVDIRNKGEGERTIVFSQFTSFLDLVEPFLLREGIKFARCTSNLPLPRRCQPSVLTTALANPTDD